MGLPRRSFLGLAVAFGFDARSILRAEPRHADFDAYVKHAMERWQLPGLAVAVVKGAEIVLANGYGVRTLNKEDAVTADTVFPIASCTKSFTAALMGRLVDDELIAWDDPIVKFLPNLGIDRAITIRHALQHRSGLSTSNMLWRRGDFDSNQILSRLKFLKTEAPPGEKFIYNNLMYLALGKVAESRTGKTWCQLIESQILKPLGMRSTACNQSTAKRFRNTASAHRDSDGKTTLVSGYVPYCIAPAGAIHSSVHDMAKWLRFHLAPSVQSTVNLLSPERIKELHAKPDFEVSKTDSKTPDPQISRYGFGWFFKKYKGNELIEHTGSNGGFIAWTTMMPGQQLGIVVLANKAKTGLPMAIRSRLLDQYLDEPEYDWSEHVRLDYKTGYKRLLREAKEKFESSRPGDAKPKVAVRELVGSYSSELYGEIRLRHDSDVLRLQFGNRFRGVVNHWIGNSYRVCFDKGSHHDWLLTFDFSSSGATSVTIREAAWAPKWYEDAENMGSFRKDRG